MWLSGVSCRAIWCASSLCIRPSGASAKRRSRAAWPPRGRGAVPGAVAVPDGSSSSRVVTAREKVCTRSRIRSSRESAPAAAVGALPGPLRMPAQVLLLELEHPLGVGAELLGRAVQEDPVPHGVGVHALPLQLLVGQLAGRHARTVGHGRSLAPVPVRRDRGLIVLRARPRLSSRARRSPGPGTSGRALTGRARWRPRRGTRPARCSRGPCARMRPMLDGHLLVDAHVHVPHLAAWRRPGSTGRGSSAPRGSSRRSGRRRHARTLWCWTG